METNDVRITLRLPKDIHEALLAASKRQDRSLNGQIVQVLRVWTEQQRSK